MDRRAYPRVWYRIPLVWMLIAIPASAVVAGLFTLYLAINSYDGLVEDDYYRYGKQINRVLSRDRRAAQLQLHGVVSLDKDKGLLTLQLTAGGSRALLPEVTLRLLHATRSGLDQRIMLLQQSPGVYAAAYAPLVPGRWHLELAAADWRLTGALLSPADDTAELDANASSSMVSTNR